MISVATCNRLDPGEDPQVVGLEKWYLDVWKCFFFIGNGLQSPWYMHRIIINGLYSEKNTFSTCLFVYKENSNFERTGILHICDSGFLPSWISLSECFISYLLHTFQDLVSWERISSRQNTYCPGRSAPEQLLWHDLQVMTDHQWWYHERFCTLTVWPWDAFVEWYHRIIK